METSALPAAALPRTAGPLIDADWAWRSLLVHDTGADGLLYIGVTSTGVYCRPICRVRTPRREHCRFFASAAQAEAAAFRPCLKCRPEIAPGPGLRWSVMDATRTLAVQAAAWFDAHAHDTDAGDGEADASAPAALAARLGIGERHLRRIFAATHGVSPLQYVQTRRLLLAKQLLTDSAMPVAQVALASGFRSLRRFNAVFAARYRMNPTRLRRDGRPDAPGMAVAPAARQRRSAACAIDAVAATLGFREPLDRAALLRFIERRAVAGIERVDGRALRRTLRPGLFGAAGGWIEVAFDARRPLLRLRYAPSLAACSGALLRAVRRWLDLDAELQAIAARLAPLWPLAGAAGVRLAGSLDAFELAVRAVLEGQDAAAGAGAAMVRLADRFGAPVATPWAGLDRTFAAPATLAAQTPGALAALGLARSRAAAVVALAGAWSDIEPLLAPGAALEPLIERLGTLPGVGAWAAHHVALRTLGWADAFPPGDAAVLSALKLGRGASAWRAAETRAEDWRPWRAYGVMTLWSSPQTLGPEKPT